MKPLPIAPAAIVDGNGQKGGKDRPTALKPFCRTIEAE